VLTWLLLAVLGIIWAALLFPSRSRSPKSSVEDFEQRMNLLAEANRAAPGRWVLMPRKGQRFMGPDRERARVRRRRRQVFMVLLEATGLTLIMGIFPPFRIMLWGTALLTFVLLVYMATLVKLRAEEQERARWHRRAAHDRVAYASGYGNGYAAGNGNGSGNGYGGGHANGDRARTAWSGNGNGYGYQHEQERADWLESGLRLVDDDVHVVVYRSDEIDTSTLTSASH
jgi:hypothetical protein